MADKSGLYASSDYKISSLTLITSTGKAINIRNIMLELDIYEDIFSPTMTGSILVGDGGDLLTNLQLHGNEYLYVEIDKPGLNQPIVKTFRIYKVSDRDLTAPTLQNYTIHFCSEELILSAQTLVSKSYKGLKISDMIKDLLKTKLSVNPDKLSGGVFQETTGNFDLIVPRMQALEAVEWLLPRAYTATDNLFFFYENRDGFNLISYEQLLKQKTYAQYTRSVKINQRPEQNFNTFNMINVVQDFDILKAIRYGAFSSTLLSLDLVSRKLSLKTFGYNDLKDAAILNAAPPVNELKNRNNKSLFDAHTSMVKYIVNGDSDPTFNPAQIDKWLPQTSSRLAQLHTFKIVASVPGDVNLTAGSIVEVIIPKMQPQTHVPDNSDIRSGRYLVSSVHHKFISDIMTTIVELLSDSVSKTLDPSQDTDPSLQTILKA